MHKHIADTAQQYQGIQASQALGANAGVQEFNSNGDFQAQLATLNGQQSQATSAADSVQGGYNADTASANQTPANHCRLKSGRGQIFLGQSVVRFLRNSNPGLISSLLGPNTELRNSQEPQRKHSHSDEYWVMGDIRSIANTGAARSW